MEHIEERKRQVDRRFQDFLARRAAKEGPLPFGRIDLLFNLADDPGERRNLGYEKPEKLAELKKYLGDWEADMAKEKPAHVVK